MKLFCSSFLLASLVVVLAAQPPTLVVTPDANYMAINGWGRCGGSAAAMQDVPVTPIDMTGATCYVNPLTRSLGEGTEHLIYWFGPGKGSDRVKVYTWYLPYADVDRYYPAEQDCTEGGACTCSAAFEELRKDWDKTATLERPCKGFTAAETPDGHECRALSFFPKSVFLKPTNMAVEPFLNKDYKENDQTVTACTMPVRLIDAQSDSFAAVQSSGIKVEVATGLVLALFAVVASI